MDRPLIELENVTLRVGDTLSFEETCWRLGPGEHWAMIGPNGSGKSTLAAAICRDIPVVHGEIRFCFDGDGEASRAYLRPGEIIRISAEAHQELIWRYADYHQARWESIEGEHAPTVAELLEKNTAAPLNCEEASCQRSREVVDLLKISGLLARNIIHLSNGEARKVLIARALMQFPRLLILDDPFGGLDDASREMLRKVVEDLLAAGRYPILLITAREDEILAGMTHLLFVDGNCVKAQGVKDQVLQMPIVRRFLNAREEVKSVLPLRFPVIPVTKSAGFETLIEMKHTSVVYNGKPVLQDITWRMRQGEHWAILGPNGAGKTTLLSLILADNPQGYANEITLFDRRRGTGETIWDIKSRIGWVSPELQLYYRREITCRQVVCSGYFDSVGLYQSCSSEQEELADRWLQSFDLEKQADRLFHVLSTGEQRIALLARALVKNPALLVLDEPCQGMDAGHRYRFIALLEQLCLQTSVSMIFVTHHAGELPDSISRILRLEEGKIVCAGERKEMLLPRKSSFQTFTENC